MTEKEITFAICHLLRELGFRKSSDQYFLKIKGAEVMLRVMNRANFWEKKKNDWNGINNLIYCQREFGDNKGYVCSVPTYEQISDFAKSKGIKITDTKNRKLTLKELIIAYRQTRHDSRAFSKYMKKISIVHASECVCVECRKQAVAFYPVIDPDIPSYPYCRECLDKIKREVLIKLYKINEKK